MGIQFEMLALWLPLGFGMTGQAGNHFPAPFRIGDPAMTRTLTSLALALAATLALQADSQAQHSQRLFINNPSPALQPAPAFLPKFGFQSFNLSGIGERVTYVQCHGLAASLGLEPGDVVLSLNGFPLTFHGAWDQALQNAMYQGGMVQLAIRDVNSGAIMYRNTYVGGSPGVGPITPKSAHYGAPGPVVIRNHSQGPIGLPGPITQKSVQNGHNNPSSGKQVKVNRQTIQQLGQLLKFGE